MHQHTIYAKPQNSPTVCEQEQQQLPTCPVDDLIHFELAKKSWVISYTLDRKINTQTQVHEYFMHMHAHT